ncbi:MAG: hypothetical protein ABJB03_00515 [Rhodoglobus sp.]
MPGIDLGANAAVSWRLAEAGQVVVLTVQQPDGTSASPTVSEAPGVYSASVATPYPGRYLLRWSKAAAPAAAYTDVFDVWPEDPRFLVSLAEAKKALQIPVTMAGDEDELRLYIAAATIVIEDMVGAILVAEVEQYGNGGKFGIQLHDRPTEVTEVTVDGVVLAPDQYVVSPGAGIVYCGPSAAPVRFRPGRQNVKITYTVGSSKISANVRLAVDHLIGHLWRISQQGGHQQYQESSEETSYSPSGFAVPRRVAELCAATPRLAGMA